MGWKLAEKLLRFDQNMEYKRPAGVYPLRDFHKICSLYPFQDALAVKVSLDLLKRLWSYGGFKLTGSGYPQIFSAPSGETMRLTPKSFQGARTCLRSSITKPSLVGLGFYPPTGSWWPKKVEFFGSRPNDHYFCSVCWFVCLSVCLCRVFLSRLWSDFNQTWSYVTSGSSCVP